MEKEAHCWRLDSCLRFYAINKYNCIINNQDYLFERSIDHLNFFEVFLLEPEEAMINNDDTIDRFCLLLG